MKCPVHVGDLAVLQFLLFYLFLGSLQLFFKNHVRFRSVCSSGAMLEVGGAHVFAILEVGGAHVFGPHTPGPHMGVFPLFPTEGFTAPWNSQQHHIALLQEDGCGERDGKGDLPEIPGEESREAAGGPRRGLGHGRLPLSAEAQRQPGRGKPEAQPFPSNEPCLWVGFTKGSLRSLYQSLHREVISWFRATFSGKQQCLLELTAAKLESEVLRVPRTILSDVTEVHLFSLNLLYSSSSLRAPFPSLHPLGQGIQPFSFTCHSPVFTKWPSLQVPISTS